MLVIWMAVMSRLVTDRAGEEVALCTAILVTRLKFSLTESEVLDCTDIVVESRLVRARAGLETALWIEIEVVKAR
jgi:hypothetical protein